MVSLQLHDEILYHLLPHKLYAETGESSFPEFFHRRINFLFIIQTLIGFGGCIYYHRWTPKPLRPDKIGTITIYQLFPMLMIHGGFYVFEMLVTTMTKVDFNRTAHHLVAIAIFLLHFYEPNAFCVVQLVPFLLHEVMWYQDEYFYLGISYNIGLITTGVITLYTSITERYIGIILPMLSVIEACVNGYYHCYTNGSILCISTEAMNAEEKILTLLIYSCGIGILATSVTLHLAHRNKKINYNQEEEKNKDN